MNINKLLYRSLLFLLAMLELLVPSEAQNVWPGDVNNNGVVNGVDALYIGIAMGATGPNRDVEGNTWQANDPPAAWSQSFSNGLNYYFADINGDGEVKPEDISEGPDDNYGQVHDQATTIGEGYANATPGTAPALEIIPSSTVVGSQTQVTFDLFLGSEEEPVTDFYGIVMRMSWNTTQGTTFSELMLEPELNPWIDPTGEDHFSYLLPEDSDSEESYFIISRTDQQTAPSGQGQIASFSIIMEDIVVGLEADTFTIKVDSILMINEGMEAIAVVPDTADVVLTDLPSPTEQAPDHYPVRVYPNPADQAVFIYTAQAVGEWSLYNARGQQLPVQMTELGLYHHEMKWPSDTPAGVYWLQGHSGSYTWTRRLIIANDK